MESRAPTEDREIPLHRRTRIQGCQRLLEDHKLDALVLTSPSSVFYLTGFLVSLYTRPIALIFQRGEQPRFIVPAIERPIADALPWDGITLDYRGDGKAAYHLIGATLSAANARTLAAEVDAFPAALAEHLRGQLPGVTVSDVSESLEPLWWEKGPAELEAIGNAAALCALAVRRARAALEAGEPELVGKAEGDHAVLTAAARRHPRERVQLFSNVIAGPRTAAGGGHDLPTGRRPQPHDIIFYVWAVNCEGYWALISRTTAVEGFSPEVQEIVRRMEAAKRAALHTVRAGVAASMVFHAATEAIGSELPTATVSIGRGIGARMGETPAIAEHTPTRLRAGMVLRIGPEVFGQFGAIGMIDTIAVTGDGYQVLTQEQSEATRDVI
jgi:Xaa-Pro dipeptidase